MPQSAKERTRGALLTLRPAYSLLLEVIEARWLRREMAALVAAVHIAAEYLPLLASASMESIGTDTGSRKTIKLKEGDQNVGFVKKGL